MSVRCAKAKLMMMMTTVRCCYKFTACLFHNCCCCCCYCLPHDEWKYCCYSRCN